MFVSQAEGLKVYGVCAFLLDHTSLGLGCDPLPEHGSCCWVRIALQCCSHRMCWGDSLPFSSFEGMNLVVVCPLCVVDPPVKLGLAWGFLHGIHSSASGSALDLLSVGRYIFL